MANRVWHHLFGAGIARSVDNLGLLGERPSHPALLDYLALRLQRQGWSVKGLIREIVLSRTYGLAAAHDRRAAVEDPENRLLWRANRRRLQAETIRDAVLAVSGALDRRRGGPSVRRRPNCDTLTQKLRQRTLGAGVPVAGPAGRGPRVERPAPLYAAAPIAIR